MNKKTKRRFETSYVRKKHLDKKNKKKQEKANNSPKYRCAVIKNVRRVTKNKQVKRLCKVLLIKFSDQRNQFINQLGRTK